MRGWVKKGINAYLDYKSFSTHKRFVVIESDDWGSLRTKDKAARQRLNAIHPSIEKDKYSQLDSIATEEDLTALFEVLQSVKDSQGNPACMTANVCTANPDFDQIKTDQFEHFHYKPFTEALAQNSKQTDLFQLWQKGTQEKVFLPQLHGREHIHALAWLAELKAGNTDLLKAFELETWGIPYTSLKRQKRKNVQASLDVYDVEGEEAYHKEWVIDSAKIFEEHFGFKAKSFIPPAFTWHSNIHKDLANVEIKSLQGIKLQYQPKLNKTNGYKRIPHYTGEVDHNSSLIYTTRNAFFEPYMNPNKDWVDSCMTEVRDAFKTNKPVIIGAHRINFIGRLDEQHRDRNLNMFYELLKTINNAYPEVEFIDSNQLLEILTNTKS